jgi:hypothetical protein
MESQKYTLIQYVSNKYFTWVPLQSLQSLREIKAIPPDNILTGRNDPCPEKLMPC